ncbi:hypothetical protein RHGRI_010249 [Rhododendron griersonianum]|uniref:Uncharacterized protein n=1 Tax=Rhododendron griersonianum TaxID=479676 RepID=A0AAV6KIJ1_9ERIC|nr:hypothetical protein RHGRI_010249 [Rhododendron griersonianum]
MVAPVTGKPLILYLTSTTRSIGALLVQEVDGTERPVYYISRKVHGAEERYTAIERHCLALVFTAQKLRHYFLSFPIQIITKCDPARFLLSRPALTGRVARWLLALAEFDISCVTPKAIKCQALANLLAQFPSGQCEPLEDCLPGDGFEALATSTDEQHWTLSFDGAAGSGSGGAGVVLQTEEGDRVHLAYKLDFPCSNNEAEYEALILSLIAAKERGVKHLRIAGDSKLVVLQTEGIYALKEPTLAPYRTTVQKLMKFFKGVSIIHKPRSENRFPDALATLGARTEFGEDRACIEIVKMFEPSAVEDFAEPTEDWRGSIKIQLVTGVGHLSTAELSSFIVLHGELYHRGPQGWLARCICAKEAEEVLDRIHIDNCADNEIALYRRIQRQGYYWPTMKKEADLITKNCTRCSLYMAQPECLMANTDNQEVDWRQVYIDYLREGALPTERAESVRVVRGARRFFLERGLLFRRTLDGMPQVCVDKEQAEEVLAKTHGTEHQGWRKLHEQMVNLGYFWPTMEKDSKRHVRRCQACQKFGNLVHAPSVELHSVRAPYPFHTWAMDLVGPIRPASRKNRWILAATEVYTKWVEAVPLKKATGDAVAAFIKENIICRFGIPKVILSDNGTPFINHHVGSLLDEYTVDHRTSSTYYPQGNGQAEATNKTLIRILSKLLD